MNEYCVIFITTESKEEAEKLSRGLVEQKLAFCVNTVPSIQSTYHWAVSYTHLTLPTIYSV